MHERSRFEHDKRIIDGVQPWSPVAIAWLAGLIEGEGHISLRKTGARIIVRMTDRDVLLQAMAISFGNVTGPYDAQKPHHKPIYNWMVSTEEHVYAVCAAIYPFMGERRRTRILEVLAWYAAKRPALYKMHGTVTRYQRMKCRCAPCVAAGAAYRQQINHSHSG